MEQSFTVAVATATLTAAIGKTPVVQGFVLARYLQCLQAWKVLWMSHSLP